jgi:hypothetical protein
MNTLVVKGDADRASITKIRLLLRALLMRVRSLCDGYASKMLTQEVYQHRLTNNSTHSPVARTLGLQIANGSYRTAYTLK